MSIATNSAKPIMLPEYAMTMIFQDKSTCSLILQSDCTPNGYRSFYNPGANYPTLKSGTIEDVNGTV